MNYTLWHEGSKKLYKCEDSQMKLRGSMFYNGIIDSKVLKIDKEKNSLDAVSSKITLQKDIEILKI